jgi:hypothetical protein
VKRLALLALALAAACSDSRQPLTANVSSPSAIAAFSGVTARRPGIQAYLALASSAANEVRLLDPEEDRPVLGPTLVFPLSIPTDPRPLLLAAASLADGGADLLAVASPSGLDGPSVELIVTWEKENRALAPIAIQGVPPGAEVVALAAAPVTGVPGRARLAVGLTAPGAGWVAVLEVARDGAAAVAQAPVVKALAGAAGPIRPADLAFSPDGARLFVATPDPVAAGVHGVAQLSLADLAAEPWPVTPLDARAPTRLVAAADVIERAVVAGGVPVESRDVFAPPAVPRVYAALDPDGPAGCGQVAAIRCGIATLVPFDAAVPGSGGLAPDPARLLADLQPATAGQGLPYRAPIEVNGVPLDIAPSFAATTLATSSSCTDPTLSNGGVARLELDPAGGDTARCTTAVAAVPSSDGNVYLVDLARFQIPSRTPVLTGDTRTRVTAASAGGLALEASGAPATVPATLVGAVAVTPGITQTDQWRLEQQGVLPGLSAVRGVAVNAADVVHVAAQTDGDPGDPVQWIVDPAVASPALGVTAGDLVELTSDDGVTALCGAAVEAVLPSGTVVGQTTFPGGALRLAAGCAAAIAAGANGVPVRLTVRASELVLSNLRLGHVGRPALGVPYVLEWTAAADPDAAPAPATVAQAVARKARRFFYPADASCAAGGCAAYPGLAHPLAHGPMVAFTAVHPDPDLDPATPPPPLTRGAFVTFNTVAGYDPAVRRPSGAVLPIGAAAVDRSALPGGAGRLEVRYYVPFSDDQILIFGPGETSVTTIR